MHYRFNYLFPSSKNTCLNFLLPLSFGNIMAKNADLQHDEKALCVNSSYFPLLTNKVLVKNTR